MGSVAKNKENQNHSSVVDLQPTSLDIWQTKYQLKAKDGSKVDKNIDETYIRLARALSEVEAKNEREKYFEEFLWALRSGAIPAGRIVSNAGSEHHKPATSTINCTVSGTVSDSMDNILDETPDLITIHHESTMTPIDPEVLKLTRLTTEFVSDLMWNLGRPGAVSDLTLMTQVEDAAQMLQDVLASLPEAEEEE